LARGRPAHRWREGGGGVHPRDLLDQLVSLAKYIEEPPRMSRKLLDSVVNTYFIAPS